ncbi:MAG: hypothetical protein ACTSR2_11490, partial [Candidatus Hodarchaeales archaeon]
MISETQFKEKVFTNKQLSVLFVSKLFFFILGFIFSMTVLISVYGSEATTKLLKGISIQNFIAALTEGNF